MAIDINVPDVEFACRVKDDSTGAFTWKNVTTADIFLNKRVVVFALPGAFTPTCSSTHLPGYELNYDDILKQDIDEVYCLSVNDSFVMNAWFSDQSIDNVKPLPDGNGDFSRHFGMLVKKEHLGFGARSQRYAMVVDNARVEAIWVEDGKQDNFKGDPFNVSDSKTMLQYLEAVRDLRRAAIAESAQQNVEQPTESVNEAN